MADRADHDQTRHEWHELLVGVKTTVEGLLATYSCNVWNMYGGLNRLRNNIHRILNHRLKVTQGPYGSVLDFWNFIRGLRCLAPAMAPSIDQMMKLCQASGDLSPGQTWVRQSLMDHSLSSQLVILVNNHTHLQYHYHYDAFLCQPDYFQALITCLQAVEHNRPALLAEVNPNLLISGHRARLYHRTVRPASTSYSSSRPRPSHSRSASLPVNVLTLSDESYQESGTESINVPDIMRSRSNDPLAPPYYTGGSPKTDPVLISDNHEYAKASVGMDSSPESAKDALLHVLSKSGEVVDKNGEVSFYRTSENIADPLLNMRTYPHHTMNQATATTSSSSSGRKRLRRSQSLRHHSDNTDNRDHNYNTEQRQVFKSMSSYPNLAQVDPILESPVHRATPHNLTTIQRSVFSQLPSSGTIVISEGRPKSTDSGVSSPPPTSGLFTTTELPNFDPVYSNKRKQTHYRSASDAGLFQRETSIPSYLNYSEASLNNDLTEERSGNEAYLTLPSKGQSLLSFLSSQDFNTCAELEKENAHFNISEALIAAIEQMKWNQVLRPQHTSDDHELGDSDEEIQVLKQRIRIRRQARLKEKARGFPAFAENKQELICSPTTTPSSCSGSSPRTAKSDSSDEDMSGADADIHDTEVTDERDSSVQPSNLVSLKQSGLSLSLASMYSETELQKANSHLQQVVQKRQSNTYAENMNTVSAESVAISLLKRFSEKQLPKASDLEWLVSEQEAPQALLPLPNSYPVSPDDNENSDLSTSSKSTRLRGNLEWAPPRAQIIFNIHQAPKRNKLLASQNYCCAGCGAKVEPGYMKRYRYCEYLGKYFCPRCHTNALTNIPGRILRKWDFTKYYVSNFAYDLLKKMHADPHFDVEVINSGLYRKVKVLDSVRECRVQLQHLRVFLQTCRNGQSMLEEVEKLPAHLYSEIHVYSMVDLLEVKKNELLPKLKTLVNDAITHVQQCQLCQAKGFLCEACHHDSVIFPFDLHTVVQCPGCKGCYHKTCYKPQPCVKCQRLEERRARLAKLASEPFSDSSSDESNGPDVKR